ncbi:heavy-metal-associated domain-containing protein [Nitrosomonas mobilis]|uniref:heavy-metal-associated domain-containing protein n=1 Tax=Nitrosomonas mobilis TaxID=51642 RepID=UPI001FE0338C|nr:heavy metal-associated domain-containing protein [Nitrosomonas mobilis]
MEHQHMGNSVTTTIIPVKGMTCMGCVSSVKTVLERLPGVIKVTVTLEGAQATVEHQTASSRIEDFKCAIEEAGFDIS